MSPAPFGYRTALQLAALFQCCMERREKISIPIVIRHPTGGPFPQQRFDDLGPRMRKREAHQARAFWWLCRRSFRVLWRRRGYTQQQPWKIGAQFRVQQLGNERSRLILIHLPVPMAQDVYGLTLRFTFGRM